ncbi:hypothetical protein GCM10023116_15390 [Kistimonas scapharcae]|uniref:Uncharacterized protein n=1 Tax=Kistimonas scapharcae TaxID=1036133 RepID=A0ABP8V2G3_9GAMM
MKFLIRNFGDDQHCDTPESVIQTLHDRYAGKSVSVIKTVPSGMQSVFYVDVPNDPSLSIFDSFTGLLVSTETLIH